MAMLYMRGQAMNKARATHLPGKTVDSSAGLPAGRGRATRKSRERDGKQSPGPNV
jgi:hypothetical protein